ncbi:MAG: DUF4175 family protein [Tepidisphaeraceae bacterium]|jgi:hypothetical protein
MPPTALIPTLDAVRRRVRMLGVVYGIGIVIAAALGLLVATVFLDYLLNLPPLPRITLMLIAVGCAVYIIRKWIVLPAMQKLGLSDVAGKLEDAFPAFNDRLRTSVDFLTNPSPGSEMMKQRVISEAAELAGRFDLNQAVQTRPVWESLGAAGGAALIVAILALVLGPTFLVPAFSRLFSPFHDMPWPKRVQIEMADLPARVPVGKPVDVHVRLTRGDGKEARVYYDYGDGHTETEIMSRGADGIYTASLDARVANNGNGTMKVWVEAGDDVTQQKTIDIVQRMDLTGVSLVVTPPAYVGEPPKTVALDTAPATVVYGSKLSLTASFNKNLDPAKSVTLIPGQKETKLPDVTWSAPVGAGITGSWVAHDSSMFQIQAYDADGFANDDVTDYQVIVRPDQPPQVQITKPGRNEECTPQAVIPLRALAEDDFGIKSLKLLATRMGDKPQPLASVDLVVDGKPTDAVTWTQLDTTGEIRRWQMDYSWDLSKLDPAGLKAGDVIEYYMEVQDNFDLDGQTHDPVASGKYRITIMSQEQFGNLMADLLSQVRDQVVQIRNNQRAMKDETADLAQQTRNLAQFSNADRAQAQNIVSRQTTAAAQAKQAASKLDDLLDRMQENRSTSQDLKDLASQASQELNQVAEQPMKSAAEQINNARNQTSPNDAGNPNDQPRNQADANANQQSASQQNQNQSGQQNQNAQAQNSGQNPQQQASQQNDQQLGNQLLGNQDQSGQQQANGQQQSGQQGNQQQNGQQQANGQQQSGQQGSEQQGGQQQASAQQSNQQSGSQQQGGQQQTGQQQGNQQQASQQSPPSNLTPRQQQVADARNNALAQAQTNQQSAADRLDQLASRMGEAGGLPKAIQQLHELQQQQQQVAARSDQVGMNNLGKTPDQMSPEDRQAEQRNADDQNALADKTQRTMDQLNQQAQKLDHSDPASAQAMRQAAQTGQDQNVPSQMRNASSSEQQNQQGSAQQAQAQAQIGLQMMVRQLEEAQQRKLQELAKQLADTQQQIQALIREQSALNYDNLSLQGGDVLAKTDPKTVADLMGYAELESDALPPTPSIDTQIRLQEQTQRNASNVSKTAESLPDSAAIVSALNRASDRMSRAIPFLRDDDGVNTGTDGIQKRLAGAYDPPQIEALAALLAAQQTLGQQAQQNRQQMQQQRRDTIRAQYQKILETQKQIDADTIAIDKAPRDADGQLAHADAIRLAQLPGRQSDLADTTAKLDDQLNNMGSIVYSWANKDIETTMQGVKDLLAKPQTDQTTQAEQTRIEDQVSAMIDSLKVQPKPQRFAQERNGQQGQGQGQGQGQQGQQTPTLPPEAELHLLRQLQVAVNKSTTTIDKQNNPQADPTLIALGGRQGQLRTLLDTLLQRSSQGQLALGPDPDPSDKLPEELDASTQPDAGLEHALLNDDGQPDPDQMKQNVQMIGHRMGRSKQRLASDHDPGETTQEIQKRILQNLDDLIQMAQAQESMQQQQQQRQQGQQGQQGQQARDANGQQGRQPDNTEARNAPNGTPRGTSDPAGEGRRDNTVAAATGDIAESQKEWGALSPRQRAAVIEAGTEKPIEKFKEFIDDYSRAVNTRETEGQ